VSSLTSFFKSRFFWLNVLLFVIAIGILFFLTNLYLDSYTRHGNSVPVPDLRGQTIENVEAYLSEHNLNYLVFDSTFVVGKQPLEVLEQDPSPGSKVKTDRRIYLTVNAQKAPDVKTPNLIDASLKDARLQLENKGLLMGKITYRPHRWNVVMDMRHDGKVVLPGHQLQKGATIDLIVGDGKGVNTFSMQSLKGLSFDEAVSVISLSDLKLGKVDRAMLKGGSKGYVDRQDPLAGEKVRKGSRVHLWLTPVQGSDYDYDAPDFKNDKPQSKIRRKNDRPLDFNNEEQLRGVIKKPGSR